MEGHGRSFPIISLIFKVEKVYCAVGGCVLVVMVDMVMEGLGRSWEIREGHGKLWKVIKDHRGSFSIIRLAF